MALTEYDPGSTFPGAIDPPTFDALAADGLRFTTMHTTALCSPSRVRPLRST